MNDSLGKNIAEELEEIFSDPDYKRYLGKYLDGFDKKQIEDGEVILKSFRQNFIGSKEADLEDLCQKNDRLALAYTGYDKDKNDMRFWPENEHAQVSFLAGYAALTGHNVAADQILALILF